MMPLRDMPLLFAEQRTRDAIGPLRPRPPTKAEHTRELAAVENRIRWPARRRRKLACCNRRDARSATGERRLRGNDTVRKTMPGGDAAACVMIRAPEIFLANQTRRNAENRHGEIRRRGRASTLVGDHAQFVTRRGQLEHGLEKVLTELTVDP